MNNYILQNNNICQSDNDYNIIFLIKDDIINNTKFDSLPKAILDVYHINNKHIKIDFYKDYLYGNLFFSKYIFESEINLFFIFHDNKLYFISNHKNKETYCNLINLLNKNLDKFLIDFDNVFIIIILMIKLLIENNLKHIEKLQKQYDTLENDLLVDKEMSNFNIKLSVLRKQLAKIRKENDNINDLLDIVEYNESNFESLSNVIKIIKYQNNRLETDIKLMIDHVIQIKEIYQNQLDVSLNNSMNLFTIISAIFLPLTLITSWYGMNHKMPEYLLEYGYAIPIVLSIICLYITVYLIRKYNFLKK